MADRSEVMRKVWITRRANPKPKPPKTEHVCRSCGETKKYPEDFAFQIWTGHGKRYPASCLECNRKLGIQNYLKLKKALFDLLGNRCSEPECEWGDPRVLQVDHVNGGGSKERKTLGIQVMYRRILKDPTGYQLLCANHNWIKKSEANESGGKIGRGRKEEIPIRHLLPTEIRLCLQCGSFKTFPDEFTVQIRGDKYFASSCKECSRQRNRSKYQELKEKVLSLLGGKCSWPFCEWDDKRALQVDHVNGGGRKELISTGTISTYIKLLKDPTGYQLLCANHNWIKKYSEPHEHSGGRIKEYHVR